jgi:hypothetical protein
MDVAFELDFKTCGVLGRWRSIWSNPFLLLFYHCPSSRSEAKLRALLSDVSVRSMVHENAGQLPRNLALESKVSRTSQHGNLFS